MPRRLEKQVLDDKPLMDTPDLEDGISQKHSDAETTPLVSAPVVERYTSRRSLGQAMGDKLVVNASASPPLFTGGCCRDGHDLTIALLLIGFFACMSVAGALTIVITDTLDDVHSDAFITGFTFVVFGVIAMGFTIWTFNLEAAKRLATIVYTFRSDENMNRDRDPDHPQPTLQKRDQSDVLYANVNGSMSVVTVLVPIMAMISLSLLDVAIMSLRAFNERHETLVLSVMLYLIGFGSVIAMLVFAWRRERTAALVLSIRTELMDYLNPHGMAEPGVYTFIGDKELPSAADDVKLQMTMSSLKHMSSNDLGNSFEMWGTTNMATEAQRARMRHNAALKLAQERRAREEKEALNRQHAMFLASSTGH